MHARTVPIIPVNFEEKCLDEIVIKMSPVKDKNDAKSHITICSSHAQYSNKLLNNSNIQYCCSFVTLVTKDIDNNNIQ